MTIKQEKESLDQILQQSEDRYTKSINDLNVNVKIKNNDFKVKLYPSIQRRRGQEEIKITVMLENNADTKVKMDTSRLISIDLERLAKILWVDYSEIKNYIGTLKTDNSEYLEQEASTKKTKNWEKVGKDNYIASVLTWYLIKLSWKSDEEVKKLLTDLLTNETNEIIKNALLEGKTDDYSKVYDYSKIFREIWASDNYIVMYDWDAKIIYDIKNNKKIIKFFWAGDSLESLLRSDRNLKTYLPKDWGEENILTGFKKWLPSVIELWKVKIKNETFNKIVNKYLKLNKENSKVVLKTAKPWNEYAVCLVDNNWDVIIEKLN